MNLKSTAQKTFSQLFFLDFKLSLFSSEFSYQKHVKHVFGGIRKGRRRFDLRFGSVIERFSAKTVQIFMLRGRAKGSLSFS